MININSLLNIFFQPENFRKLCEIPVEIINQIDNIPRIIITANTIKEKYTRLFELYSNCDSRDVVDTVMLGKLII